MKFQTRNLRRQNIVIVCLLGISFVILVNHFLNHRGRSRHEVAFRGLHDDDDNPAPSYEFPGYTQFARKLKEAGSNSDKDDDNVVMALVDSGFLPMAYNFYASSILKHNIQNFLFISLDHQACDSLGRAFPSAPPRCFVYREMSSAGHPSPYQSREFKEKIYVRRFVILESLKLGHPVLFTDLDVIFLRNPISEVKQTCEVNKCDMVTQWDDHLETHNAGFIFIRPTSASVSFYKLLARFELSHGVGQLALNAALREISRKKTLKLNVAKLNSRKFRIGFDLFDHNMCPEPKEYKDALMIHNNYIIEMHNKIFRFKECMMWDWDGFDGYYSNPTRRYLSVNTWLPHGYPEHQALLNAFSIAKLLSRTMILPRFLCKTTKCNLLSRMYDHTHLHYIKRFDNITDGDYRESTFLRNHRVPHEVKQSLTPMYHISFRDEIPRRSYHGEQVVRLTPRDNTHGPTVREIIQWFGDRKEKVLRFDSLFGMFSLMQYTEILGEELVHIIRQL